MANIRLSPILGGFFALNYGKEAAYKLSAMNKDVMVLATGYCKEGDNDILYLHYTGNAVNTFEYLKDYEVRLVKWEE